VPLYLYLLHKFHPFIIILVLQSIAHKSEGKKFSFFLLDLHKVNNNIEINLREEKKGYDFKNNIVKTYVKVQVLKIHHLVI